MDGDLNMFTSTFHFPWVPQQDHVVPVHPELSNDRKQKNTNGGDDKNQHPGWRQLNKQQTKQGKMT